MSGDTRVRASRAGRILNALLNRVERGRRVAIASGPVELVVHVTDACSFSCAMCMNAGLPVEWPAEGRHTPSPPFTVPRFEELLEAVPSARRVCFAGVGEPLLNPDLARMAATAHGAGLHTEVITNGTELLGNLDWITAGDVDSISLSVNAWDADSAAQHCGVDADRFVDVERGVAALQERRAASGTPPEFSMSAVLWKGRKDDAGHIVDLAVGWKVDHLSLHELIPSSMPGFGPEAMLSEADYGWMRELRADAERRGLSVSLPELVVPGAPSSTCTSPWRSLYVDAAGGVSGCMRVETPSLENGSWTEPGIWNGPYFASLRRAHKDCEDVPDRCRYCVEAHRGRS